MNLSPGLQTQVQTVRELRDRIFGDLESFKAPGNEATTASYTVVEGDNLWRIACREMKARAEIPSLSDITTFWLQLIETNRDIIHSHDPDLIYPGEVLTLPPSGELAP